jgi:hypothetical protein
MIKIPMRPIKLIATVVLFVSTLLCLLWISPGQAVEGDSNGSADNPAGVSTSNLSIATAWKTVSADENLCIDQARTALQNAGFNNVEVVAQSVFGDYGQYKGTVRCATSEKVAFFAVAGANADTTFRRVNEIFEGF